MKQMDEKKDIVQIILLAVIAGVGGAVEYVGTYLDRSSKLPPELVGKVRLFNWQHFIAQVFVSSFCGGLVGFAFTKHFPDWTYVIAGFSGVFGLKLFNVLLILGIKFFGKQTGIDVKDVDIKEKND